MQYVITDFGAVADGKTLATAAIQAAIDTCHKNGGGRVSVPAGVFKTGTLWLKSHVELHLEMGATLLASENLDDYNAEDAYPQNFRSDIEEWCGKHLLIALGAEDIALTGHGLIDGNGHLFYDKPVKKWTFLWTDGLALSKDKVNLRPGQLLCFIECRHVHVQDIRIQNTTCWCCFFHGCEFVQVRGIVIQNPSTFANTDGIDIDACRHVTVSDCILDTADDAFAIRSSAYRLKNGANVCEFITISNCVLGSSSGAFRLGVGDSPIRHVQISNIAVKRCATAFILTTNYSQSQGRYTPISDVSFHNISVAEAQRAMKLAAVAEGEIRDVTLENIHCRAYAGSYIKCPEGPHIHNVRMESLHIEMMDKGALSDEELSERRPHALWMEEADGFTLRHVQIRGTESTAMPWEADVMIENGTPTVEDCDFELRRRAL